MTVLVTGGTGRIGAPLVAALRERDVPVVVASRTGGADPALRRRLDLTTGEGLDAALDGVRTVVLLHTDPRRAAAVDAAGTARLAGAAAAAGVQHLLLLSIVGCDRVPLPLYRAKVAAEQAVQGSGTGWTVLRAVQFHGFVRQLARAARLGPVAAAPRGWAFQPVAEATVVDQLTALVLGDARGRAPDLAGPQRLTFADAVRLVAAPARPAVVPVPLPGRTARAFAAGGNLPDETAQVAGPPFRDWLVGQGARR